MAKFEIKGYDSYSGCDIVVTARLNVVTGANGNVAEKVYTLGSIQTLSVSTHQDKKPVRVIGSANALDYTLGQRTIAGSLVFAVFDQHFAIEMFDDLKTATGKEFFLPDELPALDITITFANEYGRTSRMAIYGLRIINEGQVMSINDLYTENTYQFVATAMEPLRKGIEVGSNQSNKNNKVISTHPNRNISKPNNLGESIHDINNITNSNNFKKIYLSAIVEQPSSNEDEGLVKFYLSPNQVVGTISISDRKTNNIVKEVQINEKSKTHYAYMKPGEYSAWYHNKGQTLSNTATFAVNKVIVFNTISDDAPIIELVTNSSIKVMSNNSSHDTCVCIDITTNKKIEQELISRRCTFNNLESNQDYLIYTKLDNNFSKSVKVRTLEVKDSFVNQYKEYVKNNKMLLASDFNSYIPILDELKDENFINTLSSKKDIKSKELMLMAVKYNNEFISSINSDNYDYMPTKKIDNVFGNTFKFNNGVIKANVFIDRNNKNYYESTLSYPTEVTYTGKSNTLYNVIGINNNNIKSPRYCFYSFSDNDKGFLKNIYNSVNTLEKYDTPSLSNSKLSNLSLKCLTAKENKDKDIYLLKAPGGYINESLDLIADVDYIENLGNKDNIYYLCISKLSECLDTTTFRKIKFTDKDKTLVLNKYLTAINKDDIFALWIENEQYSIISDVGFVSLLEDSNDVNNYLKNNDCNMITKKIESNINKKGYLSDVSSIVNSENTFVKNVEPSYAQNILSLKSDSFDLLYELYKTIFNEKCINKEKYKKAIYDSKNKTIIFDKANDSQLIQICIKKDSYNVYHYDSNSAIINDNYDINIFYMIDSNPVIKSGFVIMDNLNTKAYSIDLEVI